MKQTLLSLFVMLSLSALVSAQDKWSLERCIRESLDKSLLIKQYKLNKQGYDITGKQLRLERLPNLNLNSNGGVSFGRVINPATNDFVTENSYYQSLGANSGVTVFNGFRLRNSIRQNDVYSDAADEDLHQSQNDLALNVALAYLNVLFSYENLDIAQSRVDLSKGQLDNLDKMIAAGARPENDRYDLLAQVAVDEQGLVTAKNNIDINMLSLKQQMWMEPDAPLDIERPEIKLEGLEPLENQLFDAVYLAALSTQPSIHAGELRQKASELGVDIARAQAMPSLTIGGDIGTNWSDFEKEVTGYTLLRLPQEGVYINGEPATFEVESEYPSTYRTIPYLTQLDNHLGYGVGATLSIPIFNNYAAKANIEKAKINVINSGIEFDKTKQTLKTNIENALTAAKAAKKSLEAAEATSLAARVALDNATRKAELGALNNLEYLNARNRSDTAENNLLIARYDYYFKIKVIEYYMGRGIQLN
ncbi:MAG TPA: TolC family protein [Saprospiraceae bacterium]|nr:TolC family protein [Saprospiraceae bacterium]